MVNNVNDVISKIMTILKSILLHIINAVENAVSKKDSIVKITNL